MRWKTTLALLLVTVGVGAYVSLVDLRRPNPEDRGWLAKQILSTAPEAVSQLVLDLPKAKVTVTRRGATWRLAPNNVRADEALVTRILGELNPLVSERALTGSRERPLDPKAFGLDPAVGWISLVARETPMTLLFGETKGSRRAGSTTMSIPASMPHLASKPSRPESCSGSSSTRRRPLCCR